MQKIVPFLWFDEQAEEAALLYTALFENSKINDIAVFGDDVPGPRGKVMIVDFELAGLQINALNGGPQFTFNPSLSFFVRCQDEAEIDALWARLSDGGQALMPLEKYPFAEKFGWLNDRYGLSWQLMLSGQPQSIHPYFLFVREQCGRAEEAVQFYTSLFPDSSIQHIQHFGPGMGEPEGNVMSAAFTLAGQPFAAMDSCMGHEFQFNEAFSFVVNCEDQAEVDYFWDKLTEGGRESQCGWLTDRFGVSWQIVPTILSRLMSDPNPEKAGRVTEAMLKMVKLDIAGLQAAYDQA